MKKSCTILHSLYLVNLYIVWVPSGAGFSPSTGSLPVQDASHEGLPFFK